MTPSVISMGGVPLCRENEDETVFGLLDLYVDLGGTMIDSANVYGKWLATGTNRCDINIGRWLAQRGGRERMIIATKGGHPPLDELDRPRLSRPHVEADLEESLGALRTDYVDLYYLHRDDETIPVETIIDYCDEFVRRGKIRYFGCSNWRPERIAAAQDYARQSAQIGFCINQLMWSYAEPDVQSYPFPGTVSMSGSRQYHEETGLAAIAYSSLAKGFLNKYAARETAPLTGLVKEVYESPQNVARFERARSVAISAGLTLTEIALAYILSQPFPSFAIVGSRTPSQLKEVMEAAEIELDPAQLPALEGTGESL